MTCGKKLTWGSSQSGAPSCKAMWKNYGSLLVIFIKSRNNRTFIKSPDIKQIQKTVTYVTTRHKRVNITLSILLKNMKQWFMITHQYKYMSIKSKKEFHLK